MGTEVNDDFGLNNHPKPILNSFLHKKDVKYLVKRPSQHQIRCNASPLQPSFNFSDITDYN